MDAVSGEENAEPMTCWLNRGLGACGGEVRDWEPVDAPVGFV
jgi:hypothetical protein